MDNARPRLIVTEQGRLVVRTLKRTRSKAYVVSSGPGKTRCFRGAFVSKRAAKRYAEILIEAEELGRAPTGHEFITWMDELSDLTLVDWEETQAHRPPRNRET
jgi:hypothetical protein